jgi:hypothetical protein
VYQPKRTPKVLQELLALKVEAERIVEIQKYGPRLYNIATQKYGPRLYNIATQKAYTR